MAGRLARRPLATTVVLFLLLSGLAARQAPSPGVPAPPPQPTGPAPGRPGPSGPATGPRDKPVEATGTGRIAGRVTAAGSTQPLRRAILRIHGEGLQEGRMTATDEGGRYEFKELPAGRFFLTASKAGYAAVQHGQRRPGEGGRPLDLAEGQQLGNVDFTLPPGAVITGRLTDEFGEPVADVPVRVLRYRYIDGRRQLVPSGGWMNQTDDLGRFRIWGLEAGEYYVLAAGESRSFGMGGQSDIRSGFAPTYFPGTPSLSEAQSIRVTAGQEMGPVSFAIVPARTAQVTGIVLDSQGAPISGGFVMVQEGFASSMMFTMRGGGMIRPDGTFVVSGLAPGDYVFHVNHGGGMPGGGPSVEESASVKVSVASEDVTGLTIVTSPGSLAHGQAFFEAPPPDTLKPSEFVFIVTTMEPISPIRARFVTLRDDWTFEARVHESPAVIRSTKMPEGWVLKAVMHGGVDVTDTGVEFRQGDSLDGIQLVITNRISRVTGVVNDERGRRARDYVVIVFAEDPARWSAQSRYLGMARPAQDGRFEVSRLPAGQYLAAALDYLEDGQHTDPEYLATLRGRAVPFQLSDGEQKTLTLSLIRGQ